MASPVADSYSTVSGGVIAGGMRRDYFDTPSILSEDSTVPYTNVSSQKLVVSLHGSSGADLIYGRQYKAVCHGRLAFGAENEFRFSTARGAGNGYATDVTLLKPVDRYGTSESAWLGFVVPPSVTRNRCTERRLAEMLRWASSNLPNIDWNKVYLTGGSMGGWGSLRYGVRRADIFSAIYPDRPQWRGASTVNNVQLSTYGTGWTNVPRLSAPNFDASEGGGNTADYMDIIAYASNVANDMPWVGWCIGRQDGFANFDDHVSAVSAMRSAKRGFAFAWNNGDHGGGSILSQIYASYPVGTFTLGKGYPLFTNHSLDADPSVDLVGGINIGLSFRNVVESPSSWSCEVTHISSACAVTVEPKSKIFTSTVTPQNITIPAANSWVPVSFSV